MLVGCQRWLRAKPSAVQDVPTATKEACGRTGASMGYPRVPLKEVRGVVVIVSFSLKK